MRSRFGGKTVASFILAGVVLAGCNLQAAPSSSGTPQAWFDAPKPGTHYPLGPVQITAHGGSPSGIVAFEFSINGAASSLPSPNTSDPLVTLSHTWVPDQPGTYNLTLRSQSTGGAWSAPANTTVIIEGGLTPSPAVPPTATFTPVPFITPTFTPTFTPTALPVTGPASIEFTGISTNSLVYGGRCGDTQVTIDVRAVEPAGITVVVLFYRLESYDGDHTDFNSKAMTPIGGDNYRVTVNPTSDFGLATLNSLDDGWFEYQAVIQDKSGGTKTRTRVLSDVTFAPCGGGAPPPPVIIHTPTKTPIIPH
ncbi:MAG TPA: hypothetical protein VIU38_03505 [Anaerolineales bacterium]